MDGYHYNRTVRLDLMGVSCVGKTSYIRYIKAHPKVGKYFMSGTEAMDRILRIKSIVNKLVLMPIRYPKKALLRRLILEREFNRSEYRECLANEYDLLSQSVMDAFVMERHSPLWRLRAMERYMGLVNISYLIHTGRDVNKRVVLFDESVSVYIPLRRLEDLYRKHGLNHYLWPNGVLLFTGSDDMVVSRVQKRKGSGGEASLYEGLSEQGIYEKVREMRLANNRQAEGLEKLGIPVMRIECDKQEESTVYGLLDFCNKISSMQRHC
jgi:hypothetical protein